MVVETGWPGGHVERHGAEMAGVVRSSSAEGSNVGSDRALREEESIDFSKVEEACFVAEGGGKTVGKRYSE